MNVNQTMFKLCTTLESRNTASDDNIVPYRIIHYTS